MTMKTPLALAIACALLPAGAAMAQDKPKDKPDDTTIVIKDDTTPKVKKGTQAVTDASITTAVKTRLMKDKVARGTSIDVDTKDGVVTIAGKYCESGDLLIKDIPLPAPESGDILAIPTSGAYNLAMSSNYNQALKPAVVLVKDGQPRLMRRRQTFEDLLVGEERL